MRPEAELVVGDAFDVVPELPPLRWVFTSLPDAAEVLMTERQWEPFFDRCVRLIVDHLAPLGCAIFYQTDRRFAGRLADKAAMVAAAAWAGGAEVVWHKVAITTMGVSLFRPGYAHLVAVGRGCRAGPPTPDAFFAGRRIYPNAIDNASLQVGFNYLQLRGAGEVVDPFAGRGSVAIEAARRGLSSVSIDIDAAQIEQARSGLPPAICGFSTFSTARPT